MKRLLAGVAATAIVYAATSAYIDTQLSPATPVVVLLAGITFAALAGTMIHSTRRWSLRAVGLFLMLAGVAILLVGSFVNYHWGLSPAVIEHINHLILSLWIVGSPLSLMGVALYLMGGDRPCKEVA